MNLLVLTAIAAKKYENRQRRARAAKAYEEEQARKKQASSISHSFSYDDTLIGTVEKEMSRDGSVLFDFFSKIANEYTKYVTNMAKYYECEKKELIAKAQAINKYTPELTKAMEAEGVEVSFCVNGFFYVIGDEGLAFYCDDGLDIPKQTKEELAKLERQSRGENDVIEETRMQLALESEKAKHAILHKKQKQEQAQNTQKHLDYLEREHQKTSEQLKLVKKFSSAMNKIRAKKSEDGSDLFDNAIEEFKEKAAIYRKRDAASNNEELYHDLVEGYYRVDDEAMESTFSALKERGEISEELADSVCSFLDEEIDTVRLNESKASSQYSSLSYLQKCRLKDAANWFIENVYELRDSNNIGSNQPAKKLVLS